MIGKERQDEILNYLKIHEAVSVKSLTRLLYASEATVRRDLDELEKNGLIKRIFGGATLAEAKNSQLPLYIRERENAEGKYTICMTAKELIREGDVIFLDASSTAQTLVRFLRDFKEITVVTNGLKVANLLLESNIKTYCTGGRLINNSYAFIGRHAESLLEEMRFDICFLSCMGLSMDGDFTDTSEAETDLRRVALSVSERRVMLMTDTKLGKVYLHKLCSASDVDHIITNGTLPEALTLRSKED